MKWIMVIGDLKEISSTRAIWFLIGKTINDAIANTRRGGVNSLEFTRDRDFLFSGTTFFVPRTERPYYVLRTTIFEKHAFSQTDGQRVTLEADKITE
jgi:hypothetical protein